MTLMDYRRALPLLFAFCAASLHVRAQAAAPVEVMIVGTVHLANPGHDMHNVQVPDVLLPAAQAQIEAGIHGLTSFHPTKVMTEWPQNLATERYSHYRAGTLQPSRNEVVQLGFRLAKAASLQAVYGIDADGEFPYEPVQAFAKAHGQQPLLDRLNNEVENMVRTESDLLQHDGIVATLRWMNDPQRLRTDNAFYRQLLFVGAGSTQPGAELLSAWYRRNALICANLLQATVPGDHVVVFYGAGHAFFLRQCVTETPGYKLVEANDYLPTTR